MYLSRIQLNPARRGGQKLLASPHALHAAVLAAFPDPAARESGRVLWRLDQSGHTTFLYVVSPEEPDFTAMAEQGGWPERRDTWQVRPYGPLLSGIRTGDKFHFRLTANPVRSERRATGERGTVHGHVTVAQQQKWLTDRAARLGVDFDAAIDPATSEPYCDAEGQPLRAAEVVDRRTLTFSRRDARVTLSVATFEGTFTVVDRDAIVHALSFGVGRAKGYGCGLITIAPAS